MVKVIKLECGHSTCNPRKTFKDKTGLIRHNSYIRRRDANAKKTIALKADVKAFSNGLERLNVDPNLIAVTAKDVRALGDRDVLGIDPDAALLPNHEKKFVNITQVEADMEELRRALAAAQTKSTSSVVVTDEVAAQLRLLAWAWNCSLTEAVGRLVQAFIDLPAIYT